MGAAWANRPALLAHERPHLGLVQPRKMQRVAGSLQHGGLLERRLLQLRQSFSSSHAQAVTNELATCSWRRSRLQLAKSLAADAAVVGRAPGWHEAA